MYNYKIDTNARVYERLRLPAWLGLCDGRQVANALCGRVTQG